MFFSAPQESVCGYCAMAFLKALTYAAMLCKVLCMKYTYLQFRYEQSNKAVDLLLIVYGDTINRKYMYMRLVIDAGGSLYGRCHRGDF